MKVNINNLFFYSLLWLVFYLSGNYFGGYFHTVNIFLSIILILNMIHILLTNKFIFYNQDFSTFHPQKDDRIEYSYYIKNSLPFISSPVTVKFTKLVNLENKKQVINGKQKFTYNSSFILPYRGVYKVGYKELIICDLLNIFEIKKKLRQTTFYVYPKLKEIKLEGNGLGKDSSNTYNMKGFSNDSFQKIKNYIPGSKNSLISWKHFASKGEPYIKEFSSIENKNINIFIDKTNLPENRKGPADDKVLETTVSIINYSLKQNESVFIANNKINIENYKDFNDYYKSTVFEEFKYSKKEVKNFFNSLKLDIDDNIIIISPLVNSFFLNKDLYLRYPKLRLYIIQKCMSKERIESIKNHIDSNGIDGERVHWIN